MKYYLLKFKKESTTNVRVSAIACMDEATFARWLETPMVESNPETKVKLLLEQNRYDRLKLAYDNFYKGFSLMGLSTSTPFSEYTPAQKAWYDEASKADEGFLAWTKRPSIGRSRVTACLDYLNWQVFDDLERCNNGQELIDFGHVELLEVDESFYKCFHALELGNISECNVFTMPFEVETFTVTRVK